MKPMAPWVIDAVLIHELAHLAVRGHGPRFKALTARYPDTERAEAYLQGWSQAAAYESSPWPL